MDEFYIGDRRIRVVMEDRMGRPAPRASRRFGGGTAGPEDAGIYAFWTVMEGHRPLFIFRTREHAPIEDVLGDSNRMSAWQLKALETSADRVQPATLEEIGLWLKANPEEAVYAVGA